MDKKSNGSVNYNFEVRNYAEKLVIKNGKKIELSRNNDTFGIQRIKTISKDSDGNGCYIISEEDVNILLEEEVRLKEERELSAPEKIIRGIRRSYFEQICIEGEDGEAAKQRNAEIRQIKKGHNL